MNRGQAGNLLMSSLSLTGLSRTVPSHSLLPYRRVDPVRDRAQSPARGTGRGRREEWGREEGRAVKGHEAPVPTALE